MGSSLEFYRSWEGSDLICPWSGWGCVATLECPMESILLLCLFTKTSEAAPSLSSPPSSSLSFCLVNSGILPTQADCKINSLCCLHWALNQEHQLFCVFEIKLQVYWGHQGSRGWPPPPYLWELWYSWAIYSFNTESESHAPPHLPSHPLKGQVQYLVNVCGFDLLHATSQQSQKPYSQQVRTTGKEFFFPTNTKSGVLENRLECMPLSSERDRA